MIYQWILGVRYFQTNPNVSNDLQCVIFACISIVEMRFLQNLVILCDVVGLLLVWSVSRQKRHNILSDSKERLVVDG